MFSGARRFISRAELYKRFIINKANIDNQFRAFPNDLDLFLSFFGQVIGEEGERMGECSPEHRALKGRLEVIYQAS